MLTQSAIAQSQASAKVPCHQGRKSNLGRSLETLVIESQGVVTLTKIPLSCKRFGAKKLVPQVSPVDFFGCFADGGRMIVFDAKQTTNPTRLPTSDKVFKEHQRLEIIRYGEAGAVAGILAECSGTRELYWIDWRQLIVRKPSIAWCEARHIGSSLKVVDWVKVRNRPVPDSVEEDGDEIFTPMPTMCERYLCIGKIVKSPMGFMVCDACKFSYGRGGLFAEAK